MRKVRWTKTLEGVPLAFPSAGFVRAGEVAILPGDEAARAVRDGIGEYVIDDEKPAPGAPKAKEK